MLARGNQFLPREDQDAASILKAQLVSDGCDLRFGSKPVSFELVSAGDVSTSPEIKAVVETEG